MSLDHLAIARPPVRAKGRPDRERRARCASLGSISPKIGRAGSCSGGMRRADPKVRVEQGRVAHEGEAGVVGDVQPLVPVGDDGVGPLDSGCEMRGARAHPREEPEGPVDVEPCAVPLREVGHAVERIEVAPRSPRRRSRRRSRARRSAMAARSSSAAEIEATDVVTREAADGIAADPEHRERLVALGWMYPLEKTGTAGSPANPRASTSTPCRCAHQRRAAASAV